jgi:cytidylate kinase
VIIAIDGPAASGKGTLARRLAAALDFAFLDTGLVYRAVAGKLLAREEATAADEIDQAAAVRLAGKLRLEDLAGENLRGEAVGEMASRIAALPALRQALLAFQRRFAAHPPEGNAGAVLDGRDIGTVVCPGAEVKIFVTATIETRARRRHKELIARGEPRIYPRVEEEMRERDRRDSERAVAPLTPASDAVVLDTSAMDAEQAFRAAMAIVAEKRSGDPARPGSSSETKRPGR